MADAIYIEPINWRTVARIIEKEEPDALLPTMGGQTALNCALDLVREGVLEKYGVELIAASREAIDMAEDRELFRNAMREIGLEMPRAARGAHARGGARQIQAEIGFPTRHPPVVHAGRHAAAASPTTARSSRRSSTRGLDASPTSEVLHRRVGDRLERIRDGGRSRHATTTASSSARSRTSIRWACTRATRSRSRPRRR